MIRICKKISRIYKIKKNPIEYARKIGVDVGKDCRFLGIKSGTFGSEPYLIKIGNHVTLTSGVQFITHDGGVWIFRKEIQDIDVFGKIIVGDNVFIGISSIIMPGVTIGNNVVIGAGSVVTKNIPSNSIAAGVPAKVINTYDEYKVKSLRNSLNIKNIEPDLKKKILVEKFLN
ncbi:acyltransferase [Domibacillus mangrovi]|uniref:Capsule biosynthesis protein CapG n=1 Tax=Domibacillus mangrovi TaxID=1714354 RepID=A0A1Q5P5W2_9BACI|nr:acyltransferase [Domibacillus mangrovi]OKL37660.1 capsule biosynthesis protein CapG [Domibacillus mangrovi]